MDEAARVAAALGPMMARQVRMGALGLSVAITALFMLFTGAPDRNPALSFAGAAAIFVAILFVPFWWLLGGRGARNPFALVRPYQLGLRRLGSALLIPGLLALVVEIGYLALTGRQLFRS